MKRTPIKLTLALGATALLTACGIRGDLLRPPPIFSDPPSEEAQTPVAAPVGRAFACADASALSSRGGPFRMAPARPRKDTE